MNEPGKNSEPGAATAVRYEVLTLVSLMSVLLYLDRYCVGIAAKSISKELHLSELEMGVVFSSFFLSYGLAQVPTGWLGDRIGARLMLGSCVLIWSALTALMGLVSGLAALVTIRLLMGISQAGAYPIAARINSLWIPYPQRSLANGFVTMGGRAGLALAPGVTAGLMVLFSDQWRPVFSLYGVLGILWSVGFFVRFRETPQRQVLCNDAERDLIVQSRPPEATNPHGTVRAVPWGRALRSSGLWLQCASQVANNVSWGFLGTWLPVYMMDRYALDLGDTGLLSSAPLWAGMIGCLLGGIAADALVRRLGLRWSRNVLGIGSKLLAAVFMFLSARAGDPYLAAVAFACVSFTTDLGISATWSYFQDAGGQYVGPLLAFANMFGNLGAMAGPIVLIAVKNAYGWDTALYLCSALFVVGGVCWFGMDGRIPIVPEEQGTGNRE